MRAGLLSDPRVVALLSTRFIPCHVSALNTPDCMVDPRDVALLERYVDPDTDPDPFRERDDFDGGEREAFILPGGRMLDVFLSLHGRDRYNGCVQMTAAGRRTEEAVVPFRKHAERALLQLQEELPSDWDDVWAGSAPEVVEAAGTAPCWPEPAAGAQALRVFVRNSYRMYDDLHGCELVALPDGLAARWAGALRDAGDTAALPDAVFTELGRAMVPRGQVGTRLKDGSITGSLRLRVAGTDGDLLCGAVEGEFALEPEESAEVGLRANAACMFSSRGKLRGRFVLDRATGALRELCFCATDVELEWRYRFRPGSGDFPSWHRVGVEWVAGAPVR